MRSTTNNYFVVRAKADVVSVATKHDPRVHFGEPDPDGQFRFGRIVSRVRYPPKFVFFDDRKPMDTERAWMLASASAEASDELVVCVFRPTVFSGGWDAAAVVGHRALEELRQESARAAEKMGEARDKKIRDHHSDEHKRLRSEREAVERLFAERRGKSFGPDADYD